MAINKNGIMICDFCGAFTGRFDTQTGNHVACEEIAILQAERDKYEQALENIILGNYNNAHDINAARLYASETIRKRK